MDGPALEVTVRSGDDMQPMPARVLIYPVAPTPRPDLRSDGWSAAELASGVLGSPEGLLLSAGKGRVALQPGTYDLVLMQGPEYEQVRRRVTISGKEVARIDDVLEHTVRTDGWMAADMHIHSRVSNDSRVQPRHRVVSEVASGVQLLVPTEHSIHNDLQPQIEELGYVGRAVSIAGSEYGFNPGHAGVFPVQVDPRGKLMGAPSWQEYPTWLSYGPEMAFPLMHALPGQPVVIVNHPRLLPDLGYFHNIGWPRTPGAPLSTADLFDGMELLGGYEGTPASVTRLLRDWFFLLSDGRRIVALGNSDTHRMDWLRAGYPRTWLKLRTDDPARVLPEDLRLALLSMKAIASNGPWVNLHAGGHEIGEVAKVEGGRITLRVEADAPGWIDIDRVLIYRNGELAQEVPIAGERKHPALRTEIALEVPQEGWVVAAVVGEQPLPTDVIGAVGDGQVRPFAVTNPVWLDLDGDGKIKAPGGVPRPSPFGLVAMRDEQRARLQGGEAPLHVPLDCDPGALPAWLQ